MAAQSLIARDRSSPETTLRLTRCILGMALALGVVLASACASCFIFGSAAFTADAAVQSAMRALAPPAVVALVFCAVAMALDGISIGSDDYQHLPMVNLLGLGATAGFLQWCSRTGAGLPTIWHGMVVVFCVRFAVHLTHHLGTHASTSLVAKALGIARVRQPDARSSSEPIALLPAPAA